MDIELVLFMRIKRFFSILRVADKLAPTLNATAPSTTNHLS